jgi:hypothetical protein
MRRMEYEFQTTLLSEKNLFFFLSILKGVTFYIFEKTKLERFGWGKGKIVFSFVFLYGISPPITG